MKHLGAIGSSIDPTKLSTTVSGVIIGLSVLIIWFAQSLGFVVTNDQITTIAVQLGSAVATVVTLYGIIRKVLVAISTKFS